jgi:DNA polymerase III subunit alpha
VIEKTGFVSYFLIVGDFVRYGREQGISCVARGSAAGSIVTYLLEISNVDPIRYGLLFERFLNPERVNPPDIDIDFADDRRADVIRICPGEVRPGVGRPDHHLRHHGRQVGRARRGPGDGDELRGVRPAGEDDPERAEDDAREGAEGVPELKQAYDSEEVTRELIDTAFVLEDLTRNASVHAAGW